LSRLRRQADHLRQISGQAGVVIERLVGRNTNFEAISCAGGSIE